MNDLLQELAPISEAAWREIEHEAKRTLRGLLAARKLVDFAGRSVGMPPPSASVAPSA